MAILDPIVVNEKKELPVPDFNKKEVEGIIKDYLTKNPQILDEVLASRSWKETYESYPNADGILITGGDEHELTPEIYAFIEHCVKIGKVRTHDEYFLNLNFFNVNAGKLETICFGCETANSSSNHNNYGAHLEIYLTEDTYAAYFTEI